jgi:hypothetical protein
MTCLFILWLRKYPACGLLALFVTVGMDSVVRSSMLSAGVGPHRRPKRPVAAVLVGASLALGACHVQLVGNYDENLVNGATAMAAEIDTVLENERNPATPADATYEANRAAYNQINADLRALLVRAEANDKNQHIVNQIRTLIDTVRALENTHRTEGRLSRAYLDAKQQNIEMEIVAIMRTENAKKAASSSGL